MSCQAGAINQSEVAGSLTLSVHETGWEDLRVSVAIQGIDVSLTSHEANIVLSNESTMQHPAYISKSIFQMCNIAADRIREGVKEKVGKI